MTDSIRQQENPAFLKDQLITYIGNKRSLLPLIGRGIDFVQLKLGRKKLDCLDIFSGSGIVSRFLKQYARTLAVNDLELYAETINRCYLANRGSSDGTTLQELYEMLTTATAAAQSESECTDSVPGFITELYSPRDILHIRKGERCFYTPRNARYIDIMRQNIAAIVPSELQPFFIAPLLSEASVHANTSGVFKGFYKNSATGTGQFGGNGKNALLRITGGIELPFPLFSKFDCPVHIFRKDTNILSESSSLYQADLADGSFDLAYIDPPYNQHPYGSNYFMLNLIASYDRPDDTNVSPVSGIPNQWNRSVYNRQKKASEALRKLVTSLQAKFLLVSFNSEGFIPENEMISILQSIGSVTVFKEKYNTFRGARNLRNRNIHLNEFLYIVQK